MKASRILVTFLVMCAPIFLPVEARAQNFVQQFLDRYRPPRLEQQNPAAFRSQPPLSDLIRSGQLPLTAGDVVALMLDNNLDIGVNRLTPRASEYLIETLYRSFEPTIRLQA